MSTGSLLILLIKARLNSSGQSALVHVRQAPYVDLGMQGLPPARKRATIASPIVRISRSTGSSTRAGTAATEGTIEPAMPWRSLAVAIGVGHRLDQVRDPAQ